MGRGFFLYSLSIRGFFHRLRYDFAQELVIALSSVVLLALFYYIVRDFVQGEVRVLSEGMYHSFAGVASLLILALGAVLPGRMLVKEWQQSDSLSQAARFMGEASGPLLVYWGLRVPSVLICFYGLAHALSFFPYTLSLWVTVGGMTVLTSLVAVLSLMLKPQEKALEQPRGFFLLKALEGSKSAVKAMTLWKLGQLLTRNGPSRLSLVCAVLFSGMNALLSFYRVPFVASVAASVCVGGFGACALAFQFAQDASYAWVEKNFGVSHAQYLASTRWVSVLLGISLASLNTGLWAACAPGFSLQPLLQIFLMTLALPWILPQVIFQIDAKRPFISVVSTVLAGLLLVTCLYASLVAVVLFPVVSYYGRTSQVGRFYRL